MIGNVNKNEKSNTVNNFTELLELNFRKEKSVKFYAESLSIHPNHLNKIIKNSTNLSAKNYIHDRILQEAKYLLSALQIPVKEIAYDLGFSDYNYFCRLFKQTTKITPLQYRRRII